MATNLAPAAQAWAAVLALALHNGEEIVFGLPAWGRAHLGSGPSVWSDSAFAVVALLLVVATAVFALWCQKAPQPVQRWILTGLAAVMLLNAAYHIGLSLLTASLMPGAITAVFVLMPVFGWMAWTEFSCRRKKPRI